MSRRLPWRALVLGGGPYVLLAVPFLLRVVYPQADPPSFLDWSGGLYFDEGAYAHNARNRLLFGEWRLDQWNNMYYSPLHNLLVFASFSLFGIGFLQERLVPIVLSGLSLLLFYRLLREAFGALSALFGGIFFATNYLFIMFGRLGLLEVPVSFAGVLTLYCFAKGLADRERGWFFWAGVSSFLVYAFKNLGAYFVGAALASVAYENLRRPNGERGVVFWPFAAGLSSALLLWLLVFYWPNREAIASIGSLWLSQSLPATMPRLVSNIATQPLFVSLARTPVVTSLGTVGLFLTLYLLVRAPDRVHGVEVMASAWLVAGGVFLAFLSYRPVRYYIPFIPPLCLLAVRLVARSLRPRVAGDWVRRDPLLYLVLFAAALTLGFSGVLPYLRWEITLWTRFVISLAAAGAAVGLGVLLLRPWRRQTLRPSPVWGWALVALVLFGVWHDLSQYRQWTERPVYRMVGISRELGRLGEGAVIAGLSSPALVLENRHRAIYAGREGWFDATPDLFERHPDITHLILATYNGEIDWYYLTFPEVMRRARLLTTYHVWQTNLLLYSLREGESARAFHPVGDTPGYDAALQAVEFPFTVAPGEVFKATIAFRNTGSQPWRVADRVGLGAPRGRDPFTGRRVHPLPSTVAAPGSVATLSLAMTAPSTPGLYVSAWQMVKEGSFWFGEPHLAVIWVKPRS